MCPCCLAHDAGVRSVGRRQRNESDEQEPHNPIGVHRHEAYLYGSPTRHVWSGAGGDWGTHSPVIADFLTSRTGEESDDSFVECAKILWTPAGDQPLILYKFLIDPVRARVFQVLFQ